MWIFTKSKAINTDQCLSIGTNGTEVTFLLVGVPKVLSVECGSEDRAAFMFKDIISELGKGTLIFNVDRRMGK